MRKRQVRKRQGIERQGLLCDHRTVNIKNLRQKLAVFVVFNDKCGAFNAFRVGELMLDPGSDVISLQVISACHTLNSQRLLSNDTDHMIAIFMGVALK